MKDKQMNKSLLRVLRATHEPPLTQSQVARGAGLNATRYWQIENGEGPRPTPVEQADIALVLGASVVAIAWPISGGSLNRKPYFSQR